MDKTLNKQTVNTIPKVTIDTKGTSFKFVQVKGPTGEMYIYGSSQFASHQGQFEDGFLTQVAKVDFAFDSDKTRRKIEGFECMGGGRITIDANKKTVTVSEYSRDYGIYESGVVKTLLNAYVNENMPGFVFK
jgi:hypothetical protein